jgi:hypothetical protein
MSLDNRMTDVGTTEEHIGALLSRWKDGLSTLESRVAGDPKPDDSTKERLHMLRAAVELLTEYVGKNKASTIATRYAHLAPVYEEWCLDLSTASRFHTTACKATTEKLKHATILLYNYLSEDSSTYSMMRMVDDAVDEIRNKR